MDFIGAVIQDLVKDAAPVGHVRVK